MPSVNIRLVRELIADDPEAKKQKIARGIIETITQTIGLTRALTDRRRRLPTLRR